jgi:NAD(P)-dependent dehydrogenase (short-subunit alcohol dehydrogenase family)
MGEFEGRRVVVTGAGNGIGRCVALAFAQKGAIVCALDQDSAGLAGIQTRIEREGGKCETYCCDISDEEQCSKTIKEAAGEKGFCALINCAAISQADYAGVADDTMERFDEILRVNLRGTYLCCKLCAPEMELQAAIVNIASTRALQSEPLCEGYAAAKGGVVALTHALAMSLGQRGIRVNCISPGWVDTSAWSNRPQPQITEMDCAQHPAGRVGRPEDIAALCLFLCSEQAGFITGQNIIADGGMTRKMIYQE